MREKQTKKVSKMVVVFKPGQMVQLTKGIGRMAKLMEEADSYTQRVMYKKSIGSMEKQKERDFIGIVMDLCTMVAGRMTNSTAMVLSHSQTAQHMWVNTLMEKSMGKGSSYGKMAMYMLDNLSKTC